MISEILEYKLIDVSSYKLTVYQILLSLFLVIGTILLIKGIKRIFLLRLIRKYEKKNLSTVFVLVKYVIWVLVIVLILQTVGVNINYLIASSAALLVGVGLGLQQVFNDTISGIFLLFEGNIRVGDVIQMSDNVVATVKEINLRTSKVITRDGITIIVPNSKLISDNVINWSAISYKTRFYVEVGVDYGTDVTKVKQILLDVVKKHPKISKEPEPVVMFNDFGDSALIFRVYFWTNESFMVKMIKSDLRFDIYEKFSLYDIKIPFPQQDIYIKQLPINNDKKN